MGRGRDLQQGVACSQAHAMGREDEVVSGPVLVFERTSPAPPGASSTRFVLGVLAPYFLAHLKSCADHSRECASAWCEMALLDPLSDAVPRAAGLRIDVELYGGVAHLCEKKAPHGGYGTEGWEPVGCGQVPGVVGRVCGGIGDVGKGPRLIDRM